MKRESPVSAVPRQKRRAFLLLGGAGLLVAFGGIATWTWHERPSAAAVSEALPARPPLAPHAEILGRRLTEAEEKARKSATAIDGMIELGRLYHANDFIPEADACWQWLKNRQPREAKWTYYLADLRRMESDYAGNVALLEATLALAPDYSPAHLQLANLAFKSGDLETAGRYYRDRLKALPQDPYARLGQARIALQQGQPNEAKRLLEELLKDSPHFSSGHNLYAELLATAGDEAGANRHRWLGRETLRYREPDDPWLDELRAWCYDYDRLCVFGTVELQTEQLDQAVTWFERAIEIQPNRSEAYELLASVYLKKNDAARTVRLLDNALPRIERTKSAGVFALLSQAHRQLKRPADALRVAQQGIDQIGSRPELLAELASSLADAGRHEEAVQRWQEALAKSPGDAGMNFNLAKSFLVLRRLDDALAALDRSLTLRPTYLPTLLLRGEIELQANHLDAAEKYLRPAFEFHPEDPQTRRLLARWHLQRGAAAEARRDTDAAEQNYRDGLGLDANQPELLVRLGLLYLLTQRATEAIEPLASFHRLQPESAPGCLFLGQAYAATNQREKAREVLTKGEQLADRAGNTRIANECRALLQRL